MKNRCSFSRKVNVPLVRGSSSRSIFDIEFVALRGLHSENDSPVLGISYLCFGFENKPGLVRILIMFQDRPMFSHIIQKVSARAFH